MSMLSENQLNDALTCNLSQCKVCSNNVICTKKGLTVLIMKLANDTTLYKGYYEAYLQYKK